mmetsp:Transcript_10642/g.26029  ORF Transcript_10642/g.26029 Transcript_10642/m.26029 type:complete len:129 (-) Transcript_10642:413-799(-)
MGDGTNLQKSASSAEDIKRRNSDSAVVAAPAPASGASVAETDAGVQWRRADRKRKRTSSRPQEPNAIVGGPGEIDVHAFIASTEQPPPTVSEGSTLKGNGNGGKQDKNAHLPMPLSTRQEISSRTVSD